MTPKASRTLAKKVNKYLDSVDVSKEGAMQIIKDQNDLLNDLYEYLGETDIVSLSDLPEKFEPILK